MVLCECALTHSDWNVEKPILFDHQNDRSELWLRIRENAVASLQGIQSYLS